MLKKEAKLMMMPQAASLTSNQQVFMLTYRYIVLSGKVPLNFFEHFVKKLFLGNELEVTFSKRRRGYTLLIIQISLSYLS
jgi:hypothetical protein